jgi:hypothetical protein
MSTSLLIKDLYMLQEITNSNLEIGADLVKKTDIALWFVHYEIDPDGKIDWESIVSELKTWETEGYIKILADPRTCKAKDYCFRALRKIIAVPLPADLLDE